MEMRRLALWLMPSGSLIMGKRIFSAFFEPDMHQHQQQQEAKHW
jgi:hypothetical protein